MPAGWWRSGSSSSPTEVPGQEDLRRRDDISVFEVRTLRDGGQRTDEVAGWIAEFIGGARRRWTSRSTTSTSSRRRRRSSPVITTAVGRGVEVRFLYNVDHRNPIPVPPPPEPDAKLIASLAVPARAIGADPMHHKYVVRDDETVWTGSMNWTDDSFSRQENDRHRNLARAGDALHRELRGAGERGAVERSGFVDSAPVLVGGQRVRTWFTPGHGENLSHRIAKAIAKARRRVRICSPVITAAPVLGSLAQVISEGRVDVAGCVDRPQIGGVIHQWGVDGNASWKLPLLGAC